MTFYAIKKYSSIFKFIGHSLLILLISMSLYNCTMGVVEPEIEIDLEEKEEKDVRIEDFIGEYEGRYNFVNGWSSYSPKIELDSNSSNRIIFSDFSSVRLPFEAIVEDSNISIFEQELKHQESSHFPDEIRDVITKIEGSGIFHEDSIIIEVMATKRYLSFESSHDVSGVIRISKKN